MSTNIGASTATHETDGRPPHASLILLAVTAAVVIVTLDTTILNVAIPTIRRDLETDLLSLQWVITGYSLTLGCLFIIGGRLGDLVGTRRTFVVGALLFALGSFLASTAGSVTALLLGEAIIEGVGAALLLPASLATLSMSFAGRSRARAFALWGGAAGAAAALGPVIGGWLTTHASWRWGFRLNVVVAPVAALISVLVLPKVARGRARLRLDIVGALTVGIALFLLVFGISQGPTYGWWIAARPLTVAGAVVWSGSAPVSPIPLALAASVLGLLAFWALERRNESAGGEPLVRFGSLRQPSFRYGLLGAAFLVAAQAGTYFVLAVFLQTVIRLSAADAGGWLVPLGLAVLVGAQVGGRFANVIGPTLVVRLGMTVAALGIGILALTLSPTVPFAWVAVASAVFGVGGGLASSQLTNMVLSEVPRPLAGSASGIAATNNSIGAVLGVAVLGTILRTNPGVTGARWALVAGVTAVCLGGLAMLRVPSQRPPSRDGGAAGTDGTSGSTTPVGDTTSVGSPPSRRKMRRRARMFRAVNVVMRRLLGLPFPTPLSRNLMLLSYTGRRSGRAYRQPVSYVIDGDTLLTPGGGNWKLNLRDGEPVTARMRGRDVLLIPELVRTPDEVERLLARMIEVNPRVASFIPFVGPDKKVDRDLLVGALEHGFLVVRWHRGGDAEFLAQPGKEPAGRR